MRSSTLNQGHLVVRVGYLCMQSEFSVKPLEALLAAGHDVRFVVRPMGREQRRAPRLERADPVSLGRARPHDVMRCDPFVVAERERIPRYWVGDASCHRARSLYRRERVDVLVVAFFNQLLRAEAFEALPFGAINAHPSLLPEYRGPAPLFWTFYDARTTTGVSVHRVSRGEDTGPVLQRTKVDIPFGTRGEALVPALAAAATEGVLAALSQLERGGAVGDEQDHARATHAPRPTAQQLRIDATWEARRLFAFVRGVGRWNRLLYPAGELTLRCLDALALDEQQEVPGDWVLVGDRLTLACREGSVTLRVQAVESQ